MEEMVFSLKVSSTLVDLQICRFTQIGRRCCRLAAGWPPMAAVGGLATDGRRLAADGRKWFPWRFEPKSCRFADLRSRVGGCTGFHSGGHGWVGGAARISRFQDFMQSWVVGLAT